jgi:hypothetical protein
MQEKEFKSLNETAIRAIVHETVAETLSNIGFDTSAPSDIQADMYYLRRIRKGSEDMRGIVRRSLLTLAVSTSLFLLWEAIKHSLKGDI